MDVAAKIRFENGDYRGALLLYREAARLWSTVRYEDDPEMEAYCENIDALSADVSRAEEQTQSVVAETGGGEVAFIPPVQTRTKTMRGRELPRRKSSPGRAEIGV